MKVPSRGIISTAIMALAILVTLMSVAHAAVEAESSAGSVSPWAIIAAAGSLVTVITFILRLARREVRAEVATLRLEIAALQAQLLEAFRRRSCAMPPRARVTADDEEDDR